MSTTVSILGPIELVDPDKKKTERSAPQIANTPSFDSRIYPGFPFTEECICQLRDDPTVQLARWAVLSQMIHTPWMYTKHKNLGTNEMTDFAEKNFLPLRNFFLMQAVFGTLDYGWQPFEIVYKPEDGYIWIDAYKALLQQFTTLLVYINNGQFAGCVNEITSFLPNRANPILQPYAINTNFDVQGTDWYGYSVFKSLRKIQYSWNVVEDVATRYDKKISGAAWCVYYPVGETKYNGVMTANDVIARDLLNALESSRGVAIPDEIQESFDDTIDKEAKGKWRIEVIEAKANGSAAFIDRQKYLDSLKMRAFALPERSILEGSKGTKAEADVHADTALSTVDARHRLLTDQLNAYSLSHLMSINFGRKYAYAIRLEPAPLVDSQFSTIKDVYRMILQNPVTLEREIETIDTASMKIELGIPSNQEQARDLMEIEEERMKLEQKYQEKIEVTPPKKESEDE